MRDTAKLFKNGRSQAVRLPLDYRFDGDEVFIRKDPETGEVILSQKPDDWDAFFQWLDAIGVPADFMDDRDTDPIPERDLF